MAIVVALGVVMVSSILCFNFLATLHVCMAAVCVLFSLSLKRRKVHLTEYSFVLSARADECQLTNHFNPSQCFHAVAFLCCRQSLCLIFLVMCRSLDVAERKSVGDDRSTRDANKKEAQPKEVQRKHAHQPTQPYTCNPESDKE